ncbi:alpha/beta hydrolase [Candidatus Bathyarchaeota archaeon]|nr:alpha/beta hydrolase [Candidatus Bathyarchaeota archaeon]
MTNKNRKTGYELIYESINQPLDHFNPSSERFNQRVLILNPSGESTDSTDLPVFFILGNESKIREESLVSVFKAYGERKDMIFMAAEHRGYGESLSKNEDQSIPEYVTISQALADYHLVVEKYRSRFTGKWIAAGYSYGGGLAISFAHSYPEDVNVVLSSSGVVDWPVLMKTYDQQVRMNLGVKLYRRLTSHVTNLKPNQTFDQNWRDRELILAFVTGFSQWSNYDFLFPLFSLLSRLSTSNFVRALRWLDTRFAGNGADNYSQGNSKLTLTREEAKTGIYSWRVWRYQQFCEAGVFWISADESESVYQRTLEELTQECMLLFKQKPPILDKTEWNPREMVPSLQVPLVYVNGGLDPWRGVCLEPDYPIQNGKYVYFPDSKHCSDKENKKNGQIVMNTVLAYI